MPKTIRHAFRFHASPDLIGESALGAEYVVLHKVDGNEVDPLRMPADRPQRRTSSTIGDGWFGFAIDAPLGSYVSLVLVAVDKEGNQSTPLPVEWSVDGKRLLRRPGVPNTMIAMYNVEVMEPTVPLMISAKSKS